MFAPFALLVFAALIDLALAAPWAFGAGFVVGFVIGARFRIERRNGKED